MIHVNVRKRPDRINLQLAWTDPLTGTVKTKSARTKNWKAAERAAANWESELQQNAGGDVSWKVFRSRFEDEHLATLAATTAKTYMYALQKFELIIGRPNSLAAVNSSVLSKFAAEMRLSGLESETINSNIRQIRSALGWANRIGILDRVPRVIMTRPTGSRGRPLTHPEVIRYFVALKKVAPGNPELIDLIKLCWLGGFRLSDTLRASYDSGPVAIDFKSRLPSVKWSIEGHKARRAERVTMTPDLARFLWTRKRTGPVIVSSLQLRTIKERLTDAGRLADISVSKKKHATAQDFRRTFGQRWALRVHPFVLKKLMRHRNLATTEQYYIDIDASDIDCQIWPNTLLVSGHDIHKFRANSEARWLACTQNVHKPVPELRP